MPELALSPQLADEVAAWYANKDFQFDWTSVHLPTWVHTLGSRDQSLRILEVGSHEGRSALFFLNYFPNSSIVCIDWWNSDTVDQEILKNIPDVATSGDLATAESRFLRNMQGFEKRLKVIKNDSSVALAELGVDHHLNSDNCGFELIYIDGNHRRVNVYRDCLLAWPLLRQDGVMIMDDYGFRAPGLPETSCPKDGVDAFLRSIVGSYLELERGYQLIIRRSAKTSRQPTPEALKLRPSLASRIFGRSINRH